jgi:hypothetical protein
MGRQTTTKSLNGLNRFESGQNGGTAYFESANLLVDMWAISPTEKKCSFYSNEALHNIKYAILLNPSVNGKGI